MAVELPPITFPHALYRIYFQNTLNPNPNNYVWRWPTLDVWSIYLHLYTPAKMRPKNIVNNKTYSGSGQIIIFHPGFSSNSRGPISRNQKATFWGEDCLFLGILPRQPRHCSFWSLLWMSKQAAPQWFAASPMRRFQGLTGGQNQAKGCSCKYKTCGTSTCRIILGLVSS